MKRAFKRILLLLLSMVFTAAGGETEAEKTAVQTFKLAPSYFIPNTASQKTGKRLVDDSQVAAVVQTQNGRVLFTPSGAYIGISRPMEGQSQDESKVNERVRDDESRLLGAKTRSVVMKAGISSAHAKQRRMAPRLEEPTASRVNFMVGAKEDWRTNVPTYRKLVYDEVWEGIRLEYLGFMDHLEFQLVLEPGSDPGQIAMETGGEQLKLLEDGRLVVSLAGAELVLSAPRAYQDIDGVREPVAVAFKILDMQNFGFTLGDYAPEFGLVIDPILSWSTFLGGIENDGGLAIALDGNGNTYVTGYTHSLNFPTTSGAHNESHNGLSDVFVSKLNSTGTELIYSTFLGGVNFDQGNEIAVDSSGNVYVTGITFSTDYPTTSGAYDESSNGFSDVFVSKLNSTGTELIYSTYLGGSGDEGSQGIAVDSSGDVYISGAANSTNYPTTSGAYNESHNGSYDAFVSKLNNTGTGLVYSTYLGGSGDDGGEGIAVDSSGNAYITGSTSSPDYPTTSGVYDESFDGSYDVFVSKLNSSGTALSYSTFLGGSNLDNGYGIALDSNGNAYVTGHTYSLNYPTTSGAYDESWNGGQLDAFVSKLNSTGTGLIYSTFIGGSDDDFGKGIAVDSSGNAFVIGRTMSTSFPTTSGAYDRSHNGSSDVFVSKLNSTGMALRYSTLLGGSDWDEGSGIAVNSSDNAYISGFTQSQNYPTTSGAYDESHNGGYEAFVGLLNFCFGQAELPLWPASINILEFIPCFQ